MNDLTPKKIIAMAHSKFDGIDVEVTVSSQHNDDMLDLIQTVIMAWTKYYGRAPSTITLPLTMWTEFKSQVGRIMDKEEPFPGHSCKYDGVDILGSYDNSQLQVS